MIIVCPKCTTRLRVPPNAARRVAPCPKCSQPIDMREFSEADVHSHTVGSTWYYMKEGWFKDQEVGPISEDSFLSLAKRGQMKKLTAVRSPEFTNNQWQNFHTINVSKLEAAQRSRRMAARQAELERLERQRIKQDNLDKLRQFIQEAIADGNISDSERELIAQFSAQARISGAEVQHILSVEGKRLLDSIVQEAIADGVITPEEEATILSFSKGLGIPLEHDPETEDVLELSRLCWLFNSCELDEFPTIDVPFRLQSREMCFGKHPVEWNGVRNSASNPLKPIGVGELYITDKRLLFLTDVDSKSMRHTSIAKVQGYSDGVLLIRTSGGNVFLRFLDDSQLPNQKLTLLLRRICLEKPGALRAVFPNTIFASHISPLTEQVVTAEMIADASDVDLEPRFTFRVVGSHIGDRQRHIDSLSLEEPLQLAREHGNSVDPRAVAVFDHRGHHLGYLKREVAAWFAPKLDRGESFTATVYRLRNDGGLIVGVYEH